MFKIPLIKQRRYILHIDADAFFASVEQVLNPELKGRPILVGGPDENRGIVSTASYEAKRFGVYSGMPTYKAMRVCPGAILVKPHFEAYREFSRKIFLILNSFSDAVEMCSIDEAFMDISGYQFIYKNGDRDFSPTNIARKILFKIYQELGISVSCGLASNKIVAKVASSINKPHKLTVIPFGKEKEFLSPLPLKSLPGIGPRTFEKLQSYNFEKIGDLNSLSSSEIIERFGVSMIPIWKKSLGINNSPVISVRSLPKSISKERTFYESKSSSMMHEKVLRELTELILVKLRAYEMKAKTVCLKIKYKTDGGAKARFKKYTFQENLGVACSSDKQIFPFVKNLFKRVVKKGIPIRLMGVGVSNLQKNYNLSLFEKDQAEDTLFMSVDAINSIYGGNLVKVGVK